MRLHKARRRTVWGRRYGVAGDVLGPRAPENAEQRSRQASRAARSKGNREVAALKAEIKQLIADVKSKALDRNDAAVMIQGYRALKDFIELERRVKETDDLTHEIEELKREYGVSA